MRKSPTKKFSPDASHKSIVIASHDENADSRQLQSLKSLIAKFDFNNFANNGLI